MGTDGKALIWDHVKASKELKLLCGFKFLTESIPRSLRISKAKGDVAIGGMCKSSILLKHSVEGVAMLCCTHCTAGTCLSFSHEDKNLFVVGAENGSIFKCSMQAAVMGNVDQATGVCVCVCVCVCV